MPRPPVPQPGDKIGIIAPASAPDDMKTFDAGCRRLAARGYHLVQGRTVYEPRGYLSGHDEVRLRELNDMLGRQDLPVLFCARGGYGTLRLLPNINYDAARRTPALIVGYSDITALQLALCAQCDLPSVSGPMIAIDWSDIDDHSEQLFWTLLSGNTPQTIFPVDESAPDILHSGTAEGRLIGGNLSVLTRLLGTPYLPSLEGAILFVEDVEEPPYRIDGMLAQLRLSGILGVINGMIFGQFSNSQPDAGKPSLTLDEVLDDYSEFISGPVVSNFAYGHCTPFTSMPIGVHARLTAANDDARLTILEPVVGTGAS